MAQHTRSTMSRSPSHRSISPGDLSADGAQDTPRPAHDSNATLVPHLASHLIAAKRSLAATALVQRADALVSAARKSIEDIAALSARNIFLRQYATRELRVLEQIRAKLQGLRDRGSAEFKAVLRQLDASDERVKKTLHLLKTTPVEPSFQSLPKAAPSIPESVPTLPSPKHSIAEDTSIEPPSNEPPTQKHSPTEATAGKCLYDFVSEQGVDDLTKVVWECIDSTHAATAVFNTSIDEFDEDLQTIADLLKSTESHSDSLAPSDNHERNHKPQHPNPQSHPDPPDAASDISGRNNGNVNSAKHIPALFRSLESHATEIADLLQSLVRHYDLCIKALKYTEGGGEAAAAADALAQVDVPTDLEELANHETPLEPISNEELVEMIQVLDNDALEVDDVVQDIREHASEMENELAAISSEATAMKFDHSRLRKAIQYLQDLGPKLGSYISAGSTFLAQWAVQKGKIAEKMDDFEGVRGFYEGFLRAYDGLILEIGRRKVVHAKMDKILSDALAKVSKLYDEDIDERESFKSEMGDFLPADLWPGLVDPPAKFEVQRVDGVENPLPEISKETMQRAMQRHGTRP